MRLRLRTLVTASGRAKLGPVMAGKITAAVTRELLRGAILIEGRAKRRAPVSPGGGHLRANIRHGQLRKRGQVFSIEVGAGSETPYAKFVEFGTGPAGKAGLAEQSKSAQRKMRLMRYTHGPRGGWPPEAQVRRYHIVDPAAIRAFQLAVRKRGTKPQPFLFPAYDESVDEIRRGLKKAARLAVKGA